MSFNISRKTCDQKVGSFPVLFVAVQPDIVAADVPGAAALFALCFESSMLVLAAGVVAVDGEGAAALLSLCFEVSMVAQVVNQGER